MGTTCFRTYLCYLCGDSISSWSVQKTGMLYQRIAKFPCDIESKVKFILWHWGWDGTRREAERIISAIRDNGFMIPKNIKLFSNSYASF